MHKTRRNFVKSAIGAGIGATVIGAAKADSDYRKLKIEGAKQGTKESDEYKMWVTGHDVEIENSESVDTTEEKYMGQGYTVIEGEVYNGIWWWDDDPDKIRIPQDEFVYKASVGENSAVIINDKNNNNEEDDYYGEIQFTGNGDYWFDNSLPGRNGRDEVGISSSPEDDLETMDHEAEWWNETNSSARPGNPSVDGGRDTWSVQGQLSQIYLESEGGEVKCERTDMG